MAKDEYRELTDLRPLSITAEPNVWGHGFFVKGGGRFGRGPDSVILAPAETITDPDRAEQLGLTADARRMRREQADR